jgi:hypothetical protein
VDVVAHMLWTGAGAALAAPRAGLGRRTIALTIAFSALPDVLQFLPLLVALMVTDVTWSTVLAYATALPGHEPPMPAAVQLMAWAWIRRRPHPGAA